jgi:hypothetical protein
VARAAFYDIDTHSFCIVRFFISFHPILSGLTHLISLIFEYAYDNGVVGYVISFFLLSFAP